MFLLFEFMKSLRLKLSGLFAQGADAGALFTLAAKLSQSIVSLLVLLAIGGYFTLELQGYYYTFLSLTAMQTFVELGLYIVVSVLASHEWSSLKLDSQGFVVGDAVARSRLSSLLRFVFAWYAIAALVFVFAAGLGGCYFLQSVGKLPLKDWIWPWVWHIGISAALLWGMPVLAFLEGCNQVRDVAKFKLILTILSACVFLVAVLWGADLWALPAMSGSTLLLLTYYFFRTKWRFFASILNQAITVKVDWRLEVFPMQWRLAVSGIASYFLMSSFVPVMFYYHGPAVAGQMGMSLQILQAIQSIALIWLSVQGPKLAMLVASGQHSAMNSVWADATILSCSAMVLGGGHWLYRSMRFTILISGLPIGCWRLRFCSCC